MRGGEEPAHLFDSDLRRRLCILLVEDDHANQQLVQYVLGKRGYRVDVASNGRCAVDAFAVGNHDAILMDCQMPEMDGYEATRRIRELEASRGGRVPILAMTANALGAHRRTCIEAGMDDLLAKPFQPHRLVQWLEGWLAREDGGRRRRSLTAAGDPRRGDGLLAGGTERRERPGRRSEAVTRAVEELEVGCRGEIHRPRRASRRSLGRAGRQRARTAPRRRGGRALASELVEAFLELAPARFEELERAVAPTTSTRARASRTPWSRPAARWGRCGSREGCASSSWSPRAGAERSRLAFSR